MSIPTSEPRTGVPAGLPSSLRHYIDGKHVDSVDGGVIDVSDPVTHIT